MNKDWKYILYLSLAFGLFIAVKLLSPKQYNWAVTFAHNDKNPYGTYALNHLMETIFPAREIHHSYKTLYEIKDLLKENSNVAVISLNFRGDPEDTRAILAHVANGGSAFISAQYFSGHFADTLLLSTSDYFFTEANVFTKKDSAALKLVTGETDLPREFFYRRDNTHNFFNQFDTTRTTVIARNDRDLPVTLRVRWGDGNIILNSTPLAFTNIYLLAHQNYEFASATLSYLPEAPVAWTEFYHLGRMEASTPLRFILTNEPLTWAYYISVVTLLLFMAFEMKRRQRIIPVIKPLANTTLEFAYTIGNLYYQSGEHKNIAEKKIAYFLEQLRAKYFIATNNVDAGFMETLSRKSGRPHGHVISLFDDIKRIQDKKKISAEELMELNVKIEKFSE